MVRVIAFFTVSELINRASIRSASSWSSNSKLSIDGILRSSGAVSSGNVPNLKQQQTKEQQEISLYANNIIKTVEDAWMKPKNIPEGLVANIKLRIKPNGRIIKSELIKSSGNIRFDNSALQAVRRVEAFHFFDSISSRLYEKEFKNIAISFNPL